VEGKKILLGVCGGIAAYKIATLVRLLVKAGAQVKVIMTPAAHQFITPLTLSTLSQQEVLTHFTRSDEKGEWNNHVHLALWADVLLIAPASANTIAKMVQGISDNLLLTVYLSARSKVMLAPAMDLDMWHHSSTQENITKLIAKGHHIIYPTSGELASGLSGAGRMEEPEKLFESIKEYFFADHPLHNVKVLLTAGPTQEPIDPVRFIGNRSSGKMGIAIANAMAAAGATVTLVHGPMDTLTLSKNVAKIPVATADEMYDAVFQHYGSSQITIMAAAVADYKIKQIANSKIKKQTDELTLELVKNKDILKSAGAQKQHGQLLIGFALETDNEQQHALEKLRHKNLDMIILNSLKDQGAGFGYDTNKISIIKANGAAVHHPLMSKVAVANEIVKSIIDLYQKKQ
jgi:phosphopantothenoylcysteine decarboxylase / phosphopantothenate---cysteine ligase